MPDAEPPAQPDDIDDVVLDLVRTIQRHLVDHPEAVDSAAHIARWWLGDKQPEATPGRVAQALDYLVRAGIVERVCTSVLDPVHGDMLDPVRGGLYRRRSPQP